MALVLAGVRLPDPFSGLAAVQLGVDVVRSGARFARDSATFALELPGRIDALLDEVAVLMARIDAVIDAAGRIVVQTEQVVAEAAVTTRAAEGVVGSASQTSATALELVELFEPVARQSAPFARKFVEHLSEDEVDAAIKMVDQLPGLVEHMEAIIPILATLDTVSPEIHELLAVTKDVRRAVIGIPGFKFFRNRGEDKLAEEEEDDK